MASILGLPDALGQYRSISDATHRFWGYFQTVAVGAAGFAWTHEARDPQLFVFLSVAFAVFAVCNGGLVVASQAQAQLAARCVRAHVDRHRAEIPPELVALADTASPLPARTVGWWHAGLSVATVLAIWWRYWTLGA